MYFLFDSQCSSTRTRRRARREKTRRARRRREASWRKRRAKAEEHSEVCPLLSPPFIKIKHFTYFTLFNHNNHAHNTISQDRSGNTKETPRKEIINLIKSKKRSKEKRNKRKENKRVSSIISLKMLHFQKKMSHVKASK